ALLDRLGGEEAEPGAGAADAVRFVRGDGRHDRLNWHAREGLRGLRSRCSMTFLRRCQSFRASIASLPQLPRGGTACRLSTLSRLDHAPGGRMTVDLSMASNRVLALVPAGSRRSTSDSRSSSNSMVKPCTSDHARTSAAPWS